MVGEEAGAAVVVPPSADDGVDDGALLLALDVGYGGEVYGGYHGLDRDWEEAVEEGWDRVGLCWVCLRLIGLLEDFEQAQDAALVREDFGARLEHEEGEVVQEEQRTAWLGLTTPALA